jgi:hypothetical protein
MLALVNAAGVPSTEPHEERSMSQTICFAMPLLPGTTDAERDEMLACWRGERASAHRASRTRHGISREATWIQPTPAGDVDIVLIEADDLAAALYGIASSSDPFDVWFRAHVQKVHGIDLTTGMTLPEQVLDFRA